MVPTIHSGEIPVGKEVQTEEVPLARAFDQSLLASPLESLRGVCEKIVSLVAPSACIVVVVCRHLLPLLATGSGQEIVMISQQKACLFGSFNSRTFQFSRGPELALFKQLYSTVVPRFAIL